MMGSENGASSLKSWWSDVGKEIWTLNFLNFSYADAPVTLTYICHMHTTSVHLYHQLWVVAL